MDKTTLRQYKALLREIALEEKSIENLRRRLDQLPAVMGKVEASMEDFPYTRIHIPVEVPEPREETQIRRRIQIAENRKAAAERLAVRIELFISGIEDSQDRQIFELVFLKGKTYQEVGDWLNLDKSSISRRIDARLS